MRIGILLSLLFFSTSALAQSLECASLFQKKSPSNISSELLNYVHITRTSPRNYEEITVSSRDNSQAVFIWASLHKATGTIIFQVKTRNDYGKHIHPKVLAKDLFALMMNTLERFHPRRIEAHWAFPDAGIKGLLLTNTLQFMKGLELGLSDAAAAESTWTGQMAKAYGFRARDIRIEPMVFGDLVVDHFVVSFERE